MKRWQWISGGVLTLALIALGVALGAQGRELTDYRSEVAAYRGELDAMYKRSWWDSMERLSALEIELEKLIISDSPEAAALRLNNIARQADGAAQDLASLPAEREGIGAAMKFVNQIADYSAALSEGIAQDRPISDPDVEQLTAIQERLSEMNAIMYDMDALDNWAGRDMPAIDMSAIARDNLSYPTLIYDGPFSDGERGGFKALGEERIDEAKALEIARLYAGGEARLTGMPSAPVQGYEVACATGMGDIELFISEMGGRVLYMLPSYQMVEQEVLSPQAQDVQGAISIATQYLRDRGFEGMTANYTQRLEGAVVINFTATQDGVTLYPDLVKVQVSGGRVVGLEAGNYWRNHVPRRLPEAELTYQQAMESVNSRLTVHSARMALIPTDRTDGPLPGERLCYEFTCSLGHSRYMVYIDAISGLEASILKLYANGAV